MGKVGPNEMEAEEKYLKTINYRGKIEGNAMREEEGPRSTTCSAMGRAFSRSPMSLSIPKLEINVKIRQNLVQKDTEKGERGLERGHTVMRAREHCNSLIKTISFKSN